MLVYGNRSIENYGRGMGKNSLGEMGISIKMPCLTLNTGAGPVYVGDCAAQQAQAASVTAATTAQTVATIQSQTPSVLNLNSMLPILLIGGLGVGAYMFMKNRQKNKLAMKSITK
jgi:hypothetical protein